jgi:hypothetical protein
MKTSKMLLILAAILSFDLSLFQAMISLRPKWSAAFEVPPALLADRAMLLAVGLFTALVAAICGLYALSGAGVITRLPFLRLGLLGIGCGCTFRGTFVIPEMFITSHLLSSGEAIPWRLVAASIVILFTGMAYLSGLALSWKRLVSGELDAERPRPAVRSIPARPRTQQQE